MKANRKLLLQTLQIINSSKNNFEKLINLIRALLGDDSEKLEIWLFSLPDEERHIFKLHYKLSEALWGLRERAKEDGDYYHICILTLYSHVTMLEGVVYEEESK